MMAGLVESYMRNGRRNDGRGWLRVMTLAGAAVIGGMEAEARAAAGDEFWPAMRGPLATGASLTAKPPVTWSETSNVKWKVKVPGAGMSTPVVWGERIFIQTAIPTAPDAGGAAGRGGLTAPPPTAPLQFVLQCLDRASGKVLWQKTACEAVPHEGMHPDDTYASASPSTDGQHVWAFFGSRGLYCYDMEGKLEWSRDFGKMKILMGFGEGASPAVYGDAIFVPWDQEGDSFIYALDKLTGKELWKQAREEKTSWAMPLVVEQGGAAQVVTAASSKVRSYDAKTGKLIWECTGLTRNVIPSPVAADGMVYCTSGYSGFSLLAIKLGKTGDLTGTDAIAWKYTKSTPYVPSMLLYEGRLYFFASNNNVLTCLEAKTGRSLIDAAKIDALQGAYASPVAADGRVYMVGRNGATVVIKAADKLEILATNTLEEKIDASPALVGSDIYLRGKEYLYCIGPK
jgi:outer membrane protein assembly factor BamB